MFSASFAPLDPCSLPFIERFNYTLPHLFPLCFLRVHLQFDHPDSLSGNGISILNHLKVEWLIHRFNTTLLWLIH
ncbi:hypothetical protein ABF87_05940 [Nitrosomonas sp. JL21]|nr:hypothetical protein [Nitrosomonas sp. JL21]